MIAEIVISILIWGKGNIYIVQLSYNVLIVSINKLIKVNKVLEFYCNDGFMSQRLSQSK